MRLITNIELNMHTESELAALFRQASEALARSGRESPERRNALASLENIGRARASRMAAERA